MTGDELAGLLERGEIALLDVRSQEEYEGSAGYPCDPVQGHIPGAVHLDVNELYAAGGDQAMVRRFLEERGIAGGQAGGRLLPLRAALGDRRRAPTRGRRRRGQLRGLVARVVAPAAG